MKQWDSGGAYERYMGRWSRPIAREFVRWLNVPPGGWWLDVGCGTGALTHLVLEAAAPSGVQGVDPSPEFVTYARAQIADQRAMFAVGSSDLLFETGAFDAAVSGLALNFMPESSLDAMRRVVKMGGIVGAYVWDYAGKMEWLRYFWDSAVALDPAARAVDEGVRFPLCQPDALRALFAAAGLADVAVEAIDTPTPFASFEDYWEPFLSGGFPAPLYVASLSEDRRAALRDDLRQRLPVNGDGSIELRARAWAVKGMVV